MNGVITSEALAAQRDAYSALFKRGLNGTASIGLVLATVNNSTTGTVKYGWLGALPKFKKWMGERVYESVKEKAYSLTADKFTANVEIPVDDWDDDTLGSYNTVIEMWGQQAGSLEDYLIFDALLNGHQRECYDGQNFFDTDHVMEYKDANGVTQTSTVSNMSTGGAKQPWFFVDLSQILKPILLQRRKPAAFWMQTDANSEYVQMHQKVPMHGTARLAAGYTLWQLAFRGTRTVDAAAWEEAKALADSLVDEAGEKQGVRYTHLFVGSSNEADATKLFEAALVAGGESNIYLNKVKVVVCPRLS